MPENEIDKAKQKAIDALKDRISEMSNAAYSILLETIEKTFDIKQGKIVADKNFIKQLNKLTIEVLDLIQSSPKFTGAVSQFVKRMPAISDAITDFQKEVNGIKAPSFEVQNKIVVDEVIDKLLDNGINQHFIQPIRDLLYQNVSTGGLSLSDARGLIKDYIKGGQDVSGKLGRYVEQTAQQAVDGYSSLINQKLLETFDYDAVLITGTIIDNSSPQCKFAIEELKGKITRETWPQVVAHVSKRFPLIEGTTFDNLPSKKLHHGCRHNFFPIILKKTS